MKWIEGCPPPTVVAAHVLAFPHYGRKHLAGEPGTLDVQWFENSLGLPPRFKSERLTVKDPHVSSQWVCAISKDLAAHSPTRFAHLRLHPRNGRVLVWIGFANEWLYLDHTTYAAGSKFMPVTSDGLPVDYVAA